MMYFSSFTPLFIWSKLLLLAPVKTIMHPETQKVTYRFRKIQFFFNLVAVILLALCEIVCLYSRFQELKVNAVDCDQLSLHFIPDNMIIFIAYNLSSTVLAVSGVIQTKTNFHTLQSLNEKFHYVDETLKIQVKPSKFKYMATFLLAFESLLLCADYCVWQFTDYEKGVFVGSCANRLISATLLLHYEEIVCGFTTRFERINRELQRELETYFRRDVMEIVTNGRYKVVPAKTLSRKRVGELFQLFWLMCQGVQLINNNFGLFIFAMIVITSFQLVALPHYFLITLFNANQPVPAEYKKCALTDCLWMACFCIQLFVLVIPPAFASIEGQKTAVIVCKYLNPRTERCFLEELKSFVFHQNPLFYEFMATDILKLKLPLLTSVIGITVTYLLISIQIRDVADSF